jgi:hypothetical protein
MGSTVSAALTGALQQQHHQQHCNGITMGSTVTAAPAEAL